MDDENGGGSLLGYLVWRLLPAAAVLVSYWILARLPEEFTVLSWAAFGVSGFLFCVGFFPLAADLPEGSDGSRPLFLSVGMLLFAAALEAAGTLYVYMDGGSERSIVASVLLLCEGMVFYGYTDKGLREAKTTKSLLRLLVWALAALGFWLLYQFLFHENERGQIEAATMLWIESAALFLTLKEKADGEA